MEDVQDIIAAFVDDERVDADALKRALARPEGRDYLVDLLALRGLISDGAAHGFGTHVSAARPPTTRLWLGIAAGLLLVVSGLAGATLGYRLFPQAPPAAVQPAAQPAGESNAGVAAPAPTRVIRLRPGIDWTEREGGD